MKLIADSGATKTHWLLINDNHEEQLIQTMGINPFHQSEEFIFQIIHNELKNSLKLDSNGIKEVFFYGAGCIAETKGVVIKALQQSFPQADIHVESDLLGAARALCQHNEGIACILGTGSNSCLYDGENITDNISPLGYILGDEGSGAYLGKRFIGDCLKRQLPADLCEGFMNEYQLTRTDILNKVYKEKMANRFLASLTPYIHKVKERPEVHHFLLDCFNQFFLRNIRPYGKNFPISFAGSIAWYFKEEIETAANDNGYTVGTFLKDPIKGLARYHK